MLVQKTNIMGRPEQKVKLEYYFCGLRRGARVAEWDGLENRYTGNCIEGSNPSLSAYLTVALF